MKKLLLLLAMLLPIALAAQQPSTQKAPATKKVSDAKFDGDFYRWVDENVSFPAGAIESGVTGAMDVTLFISDKGKLSYVKPVGEIPDTHLFLELKKVLLSSPAWTPARNAKDSPTTDEIPFSYDFTKKLDEATLANMTVATDVTTPRFINNLKMADFGAWIDEKYEVPKDLKKKEYKYDVTLAFTVGKDKTLRDISVTGCDNPEITKSVTALIEKSQWRPAIINGEPRDYFISADMVLAGDRNGKIENVSFIEKREPIFPGGINAFRTWVVRELMGYRLNLEGSVKMQFVVDTDGSLKECKVLSSSDRSMSDTVVKVLQYSPKWRPAVLNGQRVKESFLLPVIFDPNYKP